MNEYRNNAEIVLRWIQSSIWLIIIIIIWSIFEFNIVDKNDDGATHLYIYLHLMFIFSLITGILSLAFAQKFNNTSDGAISNISDIDSHLPWYSKLKLDIREFGQIIKS